MPSRYQNDEELRRNLAHKLRSVVQMIEEKIPDLLLIDTLAQAVVRARLLFGRERFDNHLATIQRDSDIRESGLCTICQKNPASESPDEAPLCVECFKETQKSSEEIEKEIRIQELMKKEVEGKPS